MLTRQNNMNNLLNNATSCFKSGDIEQAVNILQQLVSQNPCNPAIYSQASLLLIENNMEIKAIEIFGHGLNNNPGDEKFKKSALEVGKIIEGKWSKKISNEKGTKLEDIEMEI